MGNHLTKKKSPIIFIHYGDSHYLKYTLELAVKFNRDKDIILIGDDENEKYYRLGLKHFYFNDYATGDKIEKFKAVFRYVAGEKFVGGEHWTRFNFYKMYALENFWIEHDFPKIWLFPTTILELSESFNCLPSETFTASESSNNSR